MTEAAVDDAELLPPLDFGPGYRPRRVPVTMVEAAGCGVPLLWVQDVGEIAGSIWIAIHRGHLVPSKPKANP